VYPVSYLVGNPKFYLPRGRNLAIYQSKRLVFGSLDIAEAFMLRPVIFSYGVMLTASTFAGQMTLATGYCQGNLASETVE